MKSRFLSVGSGQLHALEWGSGPQLLLAFHGYSNSAGLFASLAQQLGSTFTTIAIDLPGHGQTRWPAGLQLTAAALAQLTRDLCAEKKVEKTAVTAFSMGGRVALGLFLEQPQLVSQMVLAAPDGLSPNWMQRLALSASVGERLTRDVVRNPGRYQKMLDQLHRRGILSASRHQFLQHHLGNGAAVVRIQEGLIPLRSLTPSVRRLRATIKATGVPVHLLMGVSDTVIPIAPGEAFVKDLPSATLHRLAKSHRLFDGETVQQMATLLRQNL